MTAALLHRCPAVQDRNEAGSQNGKLVFQLAYSYFHASEKGIKEEIDQANTVAEVALFDEDPLQSYVDAMVKIVKVTKPSKNSHSNNLLKQVEQGIRLALKCLLDIYGAAAILSQAQLGATMLEIGRTEVENYDFGQIGDLKKLVLDLYPGGKVFNSIIDAAIAGRKDEDVAILQAINRKRRKQPKNGGGKGDLSGTNMIHLLREEGKRGTALEMKNDQKEVAVSVESSPQEELQRHNFIRQKLRIVS